MNLVDEQHVVLFEARELRREIAGPLEHGAGSLMQIDAELVGDDVRERRLTQARRAEQQRVVERLAPLPRGRDEDLELRLHARLADVLGEPARPHGAIERFVLFRRERRDDSAALLDVESLSLIARRPARDARASAPRESFPRCDRRPPSRSFSMRTTSPGL